VCASAVETTPLLMPRIHSYVVRYDSGFAPNPFYGYCTLATCKPDIRKSAKIGDWIVGSGSDDRSVRRGAHLVYAMKVTDALTFDEYSTDPRFAKKKPFRNGSRKQSCGDNIYFHADVAGDWSQLDSFHSNGDGSKHARHVQIDTNVDRVLISNDFIYFGGNGPNFPHDLVSVDGKPICKRGRGRSCFDEPQEIAAFEAWIRGFDVTGYQGPPYEWISLRD
jgi:hypothetical protein